MRSYHNMFTIKEPSTLNRPWRLSSYQDPVPISIPKEITKMLKNYHIIGVEFLYNNYKSGLNGAILNQEYDMNLPLEITAFLSAIYNGPDTVLIVCPDQLLCTWHYYTTNYGKFITKQLTIDNFDKISLELQQNQTVLLVKFSNLKLLESLLDRQYFCVIVDKFDELATKLIFNKLQSRFKIGITYRNFHGNFNQKIQWKLLNWSNPECVGQLSKFHRIDNENFTKCRDNYHYWWLRLTWLYDDRFKRPKSDEIDDLKKTIANWAELQHFSNNDNKDNRNVVSTGRKKGKRRIVDSTLQSQTKRTVRNYVKLPSMDESPMLTSIRRNFERSPEPIRRHNDGGGDDDDNQPSTSKNCSESEYFLLNLIENHQHDGGSIDEQQESLSRQIQKTLKEADDLLDD